VTCPFCDAAEVERVGQWGGQIITAQWRCRACGSYFEALREDFADRAPDATAVRQPPAPGAPRRRRAP
jgi:transposase-like protein